jgi:hypothetical protein
MTFRAKRKFLRLIPKREEESTIITKPITSPIKSPKTPFLFGDDYQAPFTTETLPLQSKWVIVRNNIHKIRSWGELKHVSVIDQPFRDWYLFFQMRRELKRASEEISAIQYRRDFEPVHHFDLPIDDTRVRRYNVSHVRPSDGIYYAGLCSEPIVLEYLLYYFSKECVVPYNSTYYSFLLDVNSVLDTNRQRIQRVVVLRRVALLIALAVFIIIMIMFFSLILSVLTTTSKLRQMYKNDPDGGMNWKDSQRPLSTLMGYGE